MNTLNTDRLPSPNPLRFIRSAMFCVSLVAMASATFAEAPPNIVVILADDLGCCDLALYGGWVKTPRIEQMARQGVYFTDFHTNS